MDAWMDACVYMSYAAARCDSRALRASRIRRGQVRLSHRGSKSSGTYAHMQPCQGIQGAQAHMHICTHACVHARMQTGTSSSCSELKPKVSRWRRTRLSFSLLCTACEPRCGQTARRWAASGLGMPPCAHVYVCMHVHAHAGKRRGARRLLIWICSGGAAQVHVYTSTDACTCTRTHRPMAACRYALEAQLKSAAGLSALKAWVCEHGDPDW